MQLEFLTVDVFTTERYKGNPLAIVKIPASLKSVVTQDQKQLIAREFNLSETVFLHEKGPSDTDQEIQIFLTSAEIPFAGHPTIGATCYVLAMYPESQPPKRLIAKAGPIDVQMNGNVALADIPHNVHIHSERIADAKISGLSDVLSIRSAEAKSPFVSIVKGMTFLLVELSSVEELGKCGNHVSTLEARHLLDEDWNAGFIGRYYYVITEATGEKIHLQTRMLSTEPEDPATGSAASALVSYLALQGKKSVKAEITQGIEMGRKSVIHVDAAVKKGGEAIESVHLSGSAVKIMEGNINI